MGHSPIFGSRDFAEAMGKSGRMVSRAGGVDGARVMQWIDRMAGGTVEVNRQPGVKSVH
jgi:hypothetical protein